MLRLLGPLTLTLLFTTAYAQTKVFKEVGEDIATEIKTITQDNGYGREPQR